VHELKKGSILIKTLTHRTVNHHRELGIFGGATVYIDPQA